MSTASAHAHYTGILKCSRMEEQKQKYNLGWPYVILCRFTAVYNKVWQDLSLQLGACLLFTSSNWTLLGTYVVFLQCAPSFLQITIVQGVQSNIIDSRVCIDSICLASWSISCPGASKWLFQKHLPEQPYLLSQCQYCSRWRRPTHGKWISFCDWYSQLTRIKGVKRTY